MQMEVFRGPQLEQLNKTETTQSPIKGQPYFNFSVRLLLWYKALLV